jgi:hypothetical protein
MYNFEVRKHWIIIFLYTQFGLINEKKHAPLEKAFFEFLTEQTIFAKKGWYKIVFSKIYLDIFASPKTHDSLPISIFTVYVCAPMLLSSVFS